MANKEAKRSPSPSTVGSDRKLFFFFLFAVLPFVLIYGTYVSRQSIDWADSSFVDNIGLMTLEGLIRIPSATNSQEVKVEALQNDDAFANKHVLITGGNRGLGRGIAARMLCAGANITITSRNDSKAFIDEIVFDAHHMARCVRENITNEQVNIIKIDLADLKSVHRAATILKTKQLTFDTVVLNAGLSPEKSLTTKQGFELALGVNCIGNYYFVQRLLALNVFPRPNNNKEQAQDAARLIYVSSETFRSLPPVDLDTLFDPIEEFGFSQAVLNYGRSKQAAMMVVSFWEKTLKDKNIMVHSLCPGPVSTDIGRNAPEHLQPFLKFLMNFFNGPEDAALPVLLLAGAPEHGKVTGTYMHMDRVKARRSDTTDPARVDKLVKMIDERIAKAFN